jgi:hypothetical protein
MRTSERTPRNRSCARVQLRAKKKAQQALGCMIDMPNAAGYAPPV